MTKQNVPPYCRDMVPVLQECMGVDADSRNLAGLIVRFTGYVITDWAYAKFRAQVMRLVHHAMAYGDDGVDIDVPRLHKSFQYNETHALWLLTDLDHWGFTCRLYENFQRVEDQEAFMSVHWNLDVNTGPRRFRILIFDEDPDY